MKSSRLLLRGYLQIRKQLKEAGIQQTFEGATRQKSMYVPNRSTKNHTNHCALRYFLVSDHSCVNTTHTHFFLMKRNESRPQPTN